MHGQPPEFFLSSTPTLISMQLHAPCSPSLAPLHYPAQATPRIFNNSHQIRQIFFFCLQAVSLLLLLPPTHPSKRQSWMMRAVKTNAENSKTQKQTKVLKSESNLHPGYTLPSYLLWDFYVSKDTRQREAWTTAHNKALTTGSLSPFLPRLSPF